MQIARRRTALLASALIAPALLAGCVPPPASAGRKAPLSSESLATAHSLPAGPEGAWPAGDWWRGAPDPALAELIDEGLRQSPDIAVAAARTREAAALARQAGASLLPALDAQGRATIDKQSYNNGFPKEFLPKGWLDNGQISAGIGLDPDLWGRNRAALAAATSEERAAAIELDEARLMLSTGIALAWYDLGRLHAERDVAEAALKLRESSRALVASRLANGLETRGSLRQAEAQAATARGTLAAVDQAIALRRNQIAALLGAGPDRGLDIARPMPAAASTAALPGDVTTALVGRRPDIAAARARVEAAAARIRVARADFFPAIRLNALIGLQSLGIGNLFEKDSTFGSAGPAISLPLFHGGALRGRHDAAVAAYDRSVADYDRAVIEAYREVADTVTSRAMVARRLTEARAALEASEEAYRIARLRYEGGLSAYLDVLAVEDRLLDARRAATAIEADARALDVALVRALGGGFDLRAATDKPRKDTDG